MEAIKVADDIMVFYHTAASFPDGIVDAHNRLRASTPFSAGRNFYGISRPENGVIVYKAAAEELYAGEAKQLGCDRMKLPAGNYVSITIPDYLKDVALIDAAFKELLKQPGLDPNGYCVEQYFNESDVQCMIRMAE